MNRRSLIVLLIGVVSALTGFATAAFVEQNRCLRSNGRWDAALRECRHITGEVTGIGAGSMVVGIVVGALLAFMLYRAVLFFAMRASRPSA